MNINKNVLRIKLSGITNIKNDQHTAVTSEVDRHQYKFFFYFSFSILNPKGEL